MANDIKLERAQSTIMRELNLILQREFPDSEVIPSLTVHEVRLTNDLSRAKIFFSSMDSDLSEAVLKDEIDEYGKDIRKILAGKIEMRSVPELEFIVDNSLDHANKIEKILSDIK